MESKNNWRAWLYLAPALVLMLIFTFYPLVNTFLIAFLKDYDYMSNESVFHSIFKDGGGLTLDNFGQVLGIVPKVVNGKEIYNTEFVKYALPNTMILTFVTVPLSVIIALLISVGLNSIKKLHKVFQTIFFVPYVTNAIAIGMVFSVIFASSNGLWNAIFNLADGTHWIDQGVSGFRPFFAVSIYIIWHSLPYKILIFLSGLQGIDKQYYQAAKIDCATKFKTFMRITVPLLSPQIFYITITSLIGAFKEYSSIVGLFNGSGTSQGILTKYNMYTVVYYIYDNIALNPSIAAAAAIILFVIIMIFTVIQRKISNTRVHY